MKATFSGIICAFAAIRMSQKDVYILHYGIIDMLQEPIVPAVCQLYGGEDLWYQQDHNTIVTSGPA